LDWIRFDYPLELPKRSNQSAGRIDIDFKMMGPAIVKSNLFNLIKSKFQLKSHHSVAVETLEPISFEYNSI